MALDLKLEIFAYNLFYTSFKGPSKEKLDIPQIFGEECLKVENYMEACHKSFDLAVLFRTWAFTKKYLAEITKEKLKTLQSPSDCFDFIISECDRDDLFGHLQIFERVFATCSFIINFCFLVSKYSNVDVKKYGYLFWVMYFDKFTKEFYEEGGWNALIKTALNYHNFFDIGVYVKENEFHILGKAIDDYYEFMDNDQYDENKYEVKSSSASILWIKYRIEQSKSCPKIAITYEMFDQVSDVDEVLENLKALFEVILGESYVYHEKASSESPDEYDIYLDSLNAHENVLNQIDESLCGLKPSLSVSDTSNLGSETKVKESNVEEDDCSKKALEINCSLKNREQKIEITERTKIISKNQMPKSPSYISKKIPAQILDPEETEILNGTTNTSGDLFENQKEDFLGGKKFLPHSVPDPTIHSSGKSVSVEEISTDKNLGVSYTPRTVDYQKEIMLPNPTAFDSLSENQMDVSLVYRKPPPYNATDSANFSSEKCIKDSLEEINAEKVFEVSCNLKNKEQPIETAKKTETLSTKRTVKTKLDINSLNRVSKKQRRDNLHFEGQSGTRCKSKKSKTQMHVKSMCYRNPPPYTVPDALDHSLEKNIKGSVEERLIENLQEVNPSTSKNVYNQENILAKKETVPTTRKADSKCNRKSSSDILPKKQLMDMCTDNLNTENLKNECETLNTNEILPKIQMDPYLDSRISPRCSVSNATNHNMERNANAEQKLIENTFEVNYTSGIEDNQRKISNTPEIIPTNKIVTSESDGKTNTESLHIPKVLNTENQCEITDVETEKIMTSRESFESEQDDFDTQIFLRMILVLNDIRHAKFVSKALEYKADGPEKTQDVKNKRKKSKSHV